MKLTTIRQTISHGPQDKGRTTEGWVIEHRDDIDPDALSTALWAGTCYLDLEDRVVRCPRFARLRQGKGDPVIGVIVETFVEDEQEV
jgi:hypothetical protein